AGTDLRTLVAAASLANARAFGGEDYVGFHTLMALPPAFHMAAEEADEKLKPLAVLKVLFRNSSRLKEAGKDHADTLKPVTVGRERELRELLPKLLDRYKLASWLPLPRAVDDGRVAELSDAIYRGTPAQAAEVAAAALAEGTDPAAVGEAISLAANQLVLRDE